MATEKSKIAITVNGDSGVDVGTDNTFKVDKAVTWKDIKDSALLIAKVKTDFDLKEWRLKDAQGEVLIDESEFEKSTAVFAITKRKVVAYKVEHLKENINDDKYIVAEIENKTGDAGTNTEAQAKTYEFFIPQPFEQSLIKADSSTVIQIKYKRKITTIILDLKGGEAQTHLEDGKNGTKLLKGKAGSKVEVKGLKKENCGFEKWEPELPTIFPNDDDPQIYILQWRVGMRITLKGDERLKRREVYRLSYWNYENLF